MAWSESVSILSASEGMRVVASSAESGVRVPAICQTGCLLPTKARHTQQGLLDGRQLWVCVEHGVDGVQTLLLLVAGKVVKVVEEVGDGGVVVVDAVAQGVALRILVLASLVDSGDDGAGLGDGQGVHMLKVAQLDLGAHLLVLRDGRLGARDEARRLGVVDGRRPRCVGVCALAVVHGVGVDVDVDVKAAQRCGGALLQSAPLMRSAVQVSGDCELVVRGEAAGCFVRGCRLSVVAVQAQCLAVLAQLGEDAQSSLSPLASPPGLGQPTAACPAPAGLPCRRACLAALQPCSLAAVSRGALQSCRAVPGSHVESPSLAVMSRASSLAVAASSAWSKNTVSPSSVSARRMVTRAQSTRLFARRASLARLLVASPVRWCSSSSDRPSLP